METGSRLIEAMWQNKGRIVGVVTAGLLSWVFLTHGFWRALVVFILLVTGYTLGARVDAGTHPLPDTLRQYFTRRGR